MCKRNGKILGKNSNLKEFCFVSLSSQSTLMELKLGNINDDCGCSLCKEVQTRNMYYISHAEIQDVVPWISSSIKLDKVPIKCSAACLIFNKDSVHVRCY